jgi:hypothetical protein
MIMIEHFSKWVELVALSNKSSHSTSQAFLQQVINKFGACAECLTNQGSEFKTYLTIIELQGINPKFMALQKGWFKHVRRDFRRFASLGTKRIGT